MSGGGAYSLIWTVNYLEPHISYVLESQTSKQSSIYVQLSFTRVSDLGLTLGLSRGVDKGLIPTKVPLANLMCPYFPPPSNLITAIKYHAAKTDATVSSHSDVQFKLKSSEQVNSDRFPMFPCTNITQHSSTPQHLLPNKTQPPH